MPGSSSSPKTPFGTDDLVFLKRKMLKDAVRKSLAYPDCPSFLQPVSSACLTYERRYFVLFDERYSRLEETK